MSLSKRNIEHMVENAQTHADNAYGMKVIPSMKPALALLVPALAYVPFASQLRAQTAAGTGQYATALFPLTAGLAVFELEYEGEGSFVVRLLSDSGHVVDTLARATGIFRGAKATRVPTTGMYLYDVSAAGRWSVRVRPAGPGAGENTVAGHAEQLREAVAAGERAARAKSPARWLLGGFAGGAVLGPLGAGGVFLVASRRERPLSPELKQSLSGKDPHYVQAYSEAYQARRRSSRRTAALVGGTVGTIVFAFALVQIARWNDTGGGSGNGNGEVP